MHPRTLSTITGLTLLSCGAIVLSSALIVWMSCEVERNQQDAIWSELRALASDLSSTYPQQVSDSSDAI